MSDTKRKIEETLGLTQARRERRKPLEDLGIKEEAHDPYIRALFEQPPVDPTVATNQDVIVQPGTPGVDEPMATPPADEAPPEVPDELKEPEDEDEELRRALFNTLSELIDLGRVERDEVSIRKYAEEHEDELGELVEVLDEVVDMLVVSADITREVQTFEPESTPGQKDRGEQLKPGVGGQVSVGSTVSTVIASDQTEPKGQPIVDAVDAILAGKDVDEVLKEQAPEPFTDEPGRPGTWDVYIGGKHVGQVTASTRQEARDAAGGKFGGRGDIEVNRRAVGFGEPAEESVTEQAEKWTYYGVDISGNERFPAGGSGGTVSGVDPQDALMRAYDKTDPFMTDELEDRGVEEYLPGVWGKRGLDDLELTLVTKGRQPASKMRDLVSTVWRGEEEEPEGERPSIGVTDTVRAVDRETGEVKQEIDVAGRPKQEIEKIADTLHRRVNTKDHPFKYVVLEPGMDYTPVGGIRYVEGKTVGESVTEQMDITRAAVAVELRFSKKEEAGAAKGALLQYKGIDGVEEIADGGLVVFTTDTDVDEARNRVETIMRNARIPLESVQIEHYEPLWEQDQDQEERGLEKYSNLLRWAVARMLIHGDTEPRVTRRLVGAGLSQSEADRVVGGALDSIDNMTRPEEIASAKQELRDQPEDPPVQEQISTSDRVPYVREVPMPLARGQSGADLEAKGGAGGFIVVPMSGSDKQMIIDELRKEGVEFLEVTHEHQSALQIHLERDSLQAAALLQDLAKKGVNFDEESGVWGTSGKFGRMEQVEPELDTDREPGEERYLQPFYGPDDEEMPPEEEPSPESVIWRMDIPEDPDEFDRLAEVLNAAKEQGLIMSWTRVTGEEEEIPPEEFEEPEGEVLDLRDADIDVAVPTIEQIEPPGVELEPGDEEVPELPPEEPTEPEEEEKEYIAVEFTPETEVDEREGFPDFIAAETGDPETGEGAVEVSGWEPVGDEEEAPPEDDELVTPDEEPVPPEDEMGQPLGEGAKLMTLEPQGIYFEIRCDTMKEAERFLAVARRVRGVDEVRLDRGDKTVSGEMRTTDEKRAEDIAHRMAMQADLELTETAVNEQDPQYQRWLQQQKTAQHALKHAAGKEPSIRVRPSVWKAAGKKPAGPELPPDVQQLVKDYRAAMMSGDADLAQRVRGELEFELEILGVDVKTVLGEAGKKPRMGRSGGSMSIRAFDAFVSTLKTGTKEDKKRLLAQVFGPRAVVTATKTGVKDLDSGTMYTWRELHKKLVLGETGNPCPTPARRIRSKGRGRGLARGRGRGPLGVPVGTKEQGSDPRKARRGQGDLVEQREWRGVTPRVDRVTIRKGDDPETILLKVEGPKVIERGGRTHNVDPTGYVAFVLKEWLDRKTETRGAVMKKVNPTTVELKPPSAKAMAAVIGGVREAMDNMYVDVTGYGVTEPLEKPPGILRRVGRKIGRFGFEDERQDDRRR